MRQPQDSARSALADAVARLGAAARELPAPPLVLDGWSSVAALDYEAAAARLVAGLLRIRAALDDAADGLVAP